MPWSVLAEPSIDNSWYVETGDDWSRHWYITSDYALVTGPEYYIVPLDFGEPEEWRAWISDPANPKATFLRFTTGAEDFLVNPEDVLTIPEATQSDVSDWYILGDPN